MISDIGNRGLFTIEDGGHNIPCTLHRPCGLDLAQANSTAPVFPGVLFLNSLSPTRAARGDSYAAWADSFAVQGYLCFRVDLPGFGDSPTDPPTQLLDFINDGGYTPLVSDLIATLIERFNLSGIILFGLCAGAVSAIYAAAASDQCSGLVLLDPYFHRAQTASSNIIGKLLAQVPPGPLRRAMRGVADRALTARHRPVTSELPDNSNFRLLDCWKQIMSSGRPTIVLTAPAVIQRGSAFDYIAYIRSHGISEAQLLIHAIRGADHTFSNRLGMAAVRRCVGEWLTARFPLGRADGELCSEDLADAELGKVIRSPQP